MPADSENESPSTTEFETAAKVLEFLTRHPELCLASNSPATTVTQRASQLLKRIKQARKRESKERDREFVEQTEIRQLRQEDRLHHAAQHLPLIEDVSNNANTPSETERIDLIAARRCYVCKQPYTQLHFFYDLMCPECAASNYHKRNGPNRLILRRRCVCSPVAELKSDSISH